MSKVKKDITRLAVERAAAIAQRVREHVNQVVPYGPRYVAMTPSEFQRRVQNDPRFLAEVIRNLGAQEFINLLRGR